MEIDVIDSEKKSVGKIALDEKIFCVEVNQTILHECVVAHLANLRRGTHACKGRSQVKGSGRKPWKQKGTGNARAGSKKSPLWRGGGVTFGPTPRDYSFKVNKKVLKAALRSALSLKLKNEQLIVIDKVELEKPKTKELASLIRNISPARKTMFVFDGENRNLALASMNIPGVRAQRIEAVNLYDVMSHENIVFTSEAVEKVQARLSE